MKRRGRYRRYDWRSRRFWRVLLFEPGQGWLRWGVDEREYPEHHGEGLTEWLPCTVAPPARCVAWWLEGWLSMPRRIFRSWRATGSDRLTWEEYRCSDLRELLAQYRSTDRAQELSNRVVFPRNVERGRKRFLSQHPNAR